MEPLKWIGIGTLGLEALEGLGFIGAAAEAGAGGLALETAGAGASTLALDAMGGTALVASETVGASEVAGLGAAALAANTLAESGAGAASFESFFQAAQAAQLAADAAIPTATASEGLTTVGVVGAEVGESASLVETATSIASKIPSAGTVMKTGAATYATGDIASRVFSGESTGEALVGTAGDLTKIVATGASKGIEEIINDIDPSILLVAGLGVYLFLIR